MTEYKLLESIELENGLVLEIIDNSRIIGSDTWLVEIKFRINIEINKKIFNKITSVSEDNIRGVLGNVVTYEIRRERNFVNENNKKQVVKELRDSFVNINMKYLAHSDFSHKFIMKRYNEEKKK